MLRLRASLEAQQLKNLSAKTGDVGSIPGWGMWQPILVFFPGKSQGQKSLVGLQSMGVEKSWK